MWSLDRALLVSFGVPFTLRPRAGESRAFDPERGETLPRLLSLLHKPVKEFAASVEGDCRLRFEDGSELQGEPHDRYEAWESRGTGDLEGASLLCDIGGGSPWAD
jgi:hypothetical protein